MKRKVYGKCLVVGLGASGQWAAELLLSLGAEVSLADQKSADELESVMERFKGRPVKWFLGAKAADGFKNTELVVLSPGVPWTFPGLRAAMGRVPVTGETELAASLTTVPILGITGSNGKTTTTGLLGHICQQNGCEVFVGGNFGKPLSQFLLEGKSAEAAVLELSSYQLETARVFHAQGAAILNISPDHLDRYPDMAEYFRAKTNIFKNQIASDLAVLNEDDPLLRVKNTLARRFGFSRQRRLSFGAWVEDGSICVADDSAKLVSRPWSDFALEGVHNQENVMAATGLALSLKLSPADSLAAATTFVAEKHRLELVGEFDAVKYYDDSKGTNVGAVAMALASFQEPIVLIAGGQAKGQDFRFLYKAVSEKVKELVLIGQDRELIGAALSGAAPISHAETMAEAVTKARAVAPRGSVVLLSPACASFDMFRDYKDRGDAFAREVKNSNTFGDK